MSLLKCKKAVLVSDIHLGYDRADRDSFSSFIETYDWKDVDTFILLGDTFDFWRRQDAKILLENRDIIASMLSLPVNVIFVRGNHDYNLGELADRFYKKSPSRNFDIMRTITIKSGQKNFFLFHGYELEIFSNSYLEPLGITAYESFSESMCRSEDKTGTVASWIWELLSSVHGGTKKLKKKFEKLLDPAEERELETVDEVARTYAKNILLGMAKEDILVFGHTHRAFKDNYVINTGSWVADPNKPSHNYVEIDNGNFELKVFEQTAKKLVFVRSQIATMQATKKRQKSIKKRRKTTKKRKNN